jgi:hypothetical protein
MNRIAIACTLILTLAAPASATEMFAAAGTWRGEGRIATAPRAPLERGRCQVEIAPEAGGGDVSITGRCAVAAGQSDISLRLVRGAGGEVRAGFWSAATGQTVQFAGTETDSAIVLMSTGQVELDGTVYQSRVEVSAPDAQGFAIRQMLRAEGEEAWRLVVDMAYRPDAG